MIKQLSKAVRQFKTQLPYLPMAFGLVYRAAGGLTIAWLGLLLIQGLLPVAMVYLTKVLVDGIAQVIKDSGGLQGLVTLAPAAAAMVCILVAIEVFQSASRWLRTAQSEEYRTPSTNSFTRRPCLWTCPFMTIPTTTISFTGPVSMRYPVPPR